MGENAQITNNVEKNGSESRQEAPGGFEDVGRLMHFQRQFIKNLFFFTPLHVSLNHFFLLHTS